MYHRQNLAPWNHANTRQAVSSTTCRKRVVRTGLISHTLSPFTQETLSLLQALKLTINPKLSSEQRVITAQRYCVNGLIEQIRLHRSSSTPRQRFLEYTFQGSIQAAIGFATAAVQGLPKTKRRRTPPGSRIRSVVSSGTRNPLERPPAEPGAEIGLYRRRGLSLKSKFALVISLAFLAVACLAGFGVNTFF